MVSAQEVVLNIVYIRIRIVIAKIFISIIKDK